MSDHYCCFIEDSDEEERTGCAEYADYMVICQTGDPYAVTECCAAHLDCMMCAGHDHVVTYIGPSAGGTP